MRLSSVATDLPKYPGSSVPPEILITIEGLPTHSPKVILTCRSRSLQQVNASISSGIFPDRALRRSGKIPDEIEAFTCCRLRLRQVRITFGECVGSPSIVIKISGGTDEPGYFGRSVATDERRIEVVVGTTHRRRFRLDRRRKGQAHRIDPAEIRPDARRGAGGSRPAP